MSKIYTITADSVPDLDDWGWDDFWGCAEWISWHKAMKQKYGKPTADDKFMKWWSKQTTGASTLDCRSFNTGFREYFSGEKLLDAIYGSVAWIKPIGAAVDLIGDASDTASNLGDTATNIAKTLKIVIPIVIVLTIGTGLYMVYNKVKA